MSPSCNEDPALATTTSPSLSPSRISALSSETSTEILEGLDVGEIVVADAGTSLHDGDQIKTMFADELERTRTR